MGNIVDSQQRQIEDHKAKDLEKMKRPRSGKQIESFLGFINFLRDYIPNYALLTGPLEILRKVKRISKSMWGEKQEKAWKVIKNVVKEAPILTKPDWNEKFYVATDASQYGVGAALYQKVGDKHKYIKFASQALTPGQRNYPASKRELLAIIFALKKWRYILYGRRFVVETDHKALTYLHQSDKYMILDWLDFILEYDFEVHYRKGIHHILPDALSRFYDKPEREKGDGSVLLCVSELRVDDVPASNVGKRMRELISNAIGKKDPGQQERKAVVEQAHKESHIGGYGLYQKVFRDGYFWPGMRTMCADVAAGCNECLKYNVGRVGFHPISPLVAKLPFDIIAWDFLGPFPESKRGYKFVILIVDIVSRFVILRPLKTKSVEEVSMVILEVFANFGIPQVVQHDQDPSFMNKVFDRL